MKTILITGAAQGIGLATAKRFADKGWFVGLYDINKKEVNRLVKSSDFPKACAGHCDITKRQSIEKALQHFSDNTKGRLDVLVNNAGVLSNAKFEKMKPTQIDAMIDVNIRGLTHVAQAAFPLLKKTKNACMVNMCSASSIHGLPLLAVYSSSKFYINGLTQALSLEWAAHDIRVTSIKPPLVNTEMGQLAQGHTESESSFDVQPEDVARAVELAVKGNRDSYFLGLSANAWAMMDQVLPEAGRRGLTRIIAQKLTGF